MFKKRKDEAKNISNSFDKVVKYARKRRETALYAIRVLNSDLGYFDNIYNIK